MTWEEMRPQGLYRCPVGLRDIETGERPDIKEMPMEYLRFHRQLVTDTLAPLTADKSEMTTGKKVRELLGKIKRNEGVRVKMG